MKKKEEKEIKEIKDAEVFGLQRWCFSEIDPSNMVRFRDGAGESHVFLKF